MVRESLDEGYCDISGRVSDLIFAGLVKFPSVFMRLFLSDLPF